MAAPENVLRERPTRLVLEVFRTNGRLLAAGDKLAAVEGLTAARWQVLGAVALAGEPVPVPAVAARMGLTRQSVQASMNRLADSGLVAAVANERNRRSPLFTLTDPGRAAYARLMEAQAAWIDDLGAGIPEADVATAVSVLRRLGDRLGDRPPA